MSREKHTRLTKPHEWEDMDTHRWDKDERPCPIKDSDGRRTHKHYMECSRCGIRRHGAYAEHGAYHYFEYDHPNGQTHEVIPPCTVKPRKDRGVLDTLKICSACHHIIRGDKCENDCDAGAVELQFVRRLRVPA